MDDYTPARLYATVIGVGALFTGFVGLFYIADFTENPAVRKDEFDILAVNGWHNVVHIATGLLGLLAAGHAARAYALGFGLTYVAVAIWGFALTGPTPSILDIVPVNAADNVLHAAVGVLGVAAAMASGRGAQAPPSGRSTAAAR